MSLSRSWRLEKGHDGLNAGAIEGYGFGAMVLAISGAIGRTPGTAIDFKGFLNRGVPPLPTINQALRAERYLLSGSNRI